MRKIKEVKMKDKLFRKSNKGWFGDNDRHSHAKLTGKAGPIYKQSGHSNIPNVKLFDDWFLTPTEKIKEAIISEFYNARSSLGVTASSGFEKGKPLYRIVAVNPERIRKSGGDFLNRFNEIFSHETFHRLLKDIPEAANRDEEFILKKLGLKTFEPPKFGDEKTKPIGFIYNRKSEPIDVFAKVKYPRKKYAKAKKLKYLMEYMLEKQKPKCHFCKKSINPKMVRTKGIDLTIHHVNEDGKDNRIGNKKLAHETCHRKHHASEVLGTYQKIKNGKF